ncbi:hypothetical protein E3N88_26569 [Mikania micrantha]|uniref:Uncharacterized protein n=1 Tax=Mikania micrantha TaxID=192012 RepID=A0A5N6MUD6_9ASTR|nr:hypothetical protein E3N88_26569 [Mikania micrantha]
MRWMTERMAASAGMDVPVFPRPGHCGSSYFCYARRPLSSGDHSYRKRSSGRVPRSESDVPNRGTVSFRSPRVRDSVRGKEAIPILQKFVNLATESRTKPPKIAFPSFQFVEFGPETAD